VFARSTTIQADPQDIDAGIAYIREEVEPAVSALDGCVGLSLLVDRDSGRCIVTTSWDTEEHMATSRGAVVPLRERGAQIMGGPPDVQEWEIAVMHRGHEMSAGAWCRVTWLRGDPDSSEQSLEGYRTQVLPQIEQLPGFCSASMFVDRPTGLACGTVAFDSQGALKATREAAQSLRTGAAQRMGLTVADVAEMELLIHHLRVPELV
jgi:hypothetical protein